MKHFLSKLRKYAKIIRREEKVQVFCHCRLFLWWHVTDVKNGFIRNVNMYPNRPGLKTTLVGFVKNVVNDISVYLCII